IADGAKLHIGVIAGFIFLRIDMLMLEYYRQAQSVGFYSIAVSLSGLLILIPMATQKVFYSKISGLIDDKTDMAEKTIQVYKHALLPSVFTALLLVLLAKPLINIFYGNQFLPALAPFLILLPGVFFLWQNNILAYFLIGAKKLLLISSVAAFNSLLNVALNMILIPKYDSVGAAYSSLITYILVGLANLILFVRISKIGFKGFIKKLKVTKDDILFYKILFIKFFSLGN
ncbi:MAG: polysaccharide biosynthesis C-terminal domain-containing protein, partial [Candidatus Omnitrophica bacterium]|nr:polysaccharide biosynthesis C-terminal domain-containing protein [Candidatus Omnitrophota bacterium]